MFKDRLLVVFSAAFLLATAGCGGGASIEDMVAGGDIGRGDLGCWVTMKFDKLPDGDPRDVVVKFHSEALNGMPEFDWKYIATHDVVQQESGWGYQENTATTPDQPPPLGQITKVKFPLNAKRRIENMGTSIWLNAELHWGGKKQDSDKDNIRRIYEREDGKGMPSTM